MPKRTTELAPDPELARRLVLARTWVRASQEDVARWAGVSRRMIVDYEAGVREPPLRVVRTLAACTGTSLDWLVGDDSADRPGTRDIRRVIGGLTVQSAAPQGRHSLTARAAIHGIAVRDVA